MADNTLLEGIVADLLRHPDMLSLSNKRVLSDVESVYPVHHSIARQAVTRARLEVRRPDVIELGQENHGEIA